MSRFHPNKHQNQISTPHESPMVVTSGYYIIKKKEHNAVNDKYNKNDILLCFKNDTLLGGSSHCTLHASDLQKNILRLFTKYHSLQLYNTAMQVCIRSSRRTHMQHREEGKSQSITRPNVLGLLQLTKKMWDLLKYHPSSDTDRNWEQVLIASAFSSNGLNLAKNI